MSNLIKQSESNASRAVVYLWCVSSNGSSAATHEAGGQPKFSIGGIAAVNSSGTLLDVDSTLGLYAVSLNSSNVSALGQGVVRYSSTTVPMSASAFVVVGFDPFAALSTFSSGDSVGIKTGGIVAASFGASAIDAAALATDAGQEIADRILLRNIVGGSDSGRTVGQALEMLRNRVAIDGSTGTVFREDDTTASWVFSVATSSVNSGIIRAVDPS